jgi:periplasmic protein TonB
LQHVDRRGIMAGVVATACQVTAVLAAQARSRFTVATAIVAAHGFAIYAIAAWSPRIEQAIGTPLLVQFINPAESRPKPAWPRVDIVAPAIDAARPQVQIPEVPVTQELSERAITVQVSPAPPAPAASDAAPKLISEIEYVQEPAPHYPVQSRRLREQGLVVLKVLIDERGLACDIQIESSSGHSRLDEAAREAVSRALFRPYVEDGSPRRALVLIPIEFSLARAAAAARRASA